MTYFIHNTAEVNMSATIGKNTKIWNQVQIRENACIGSNCIISKNVYIDKNVCIGNNVKIQNNVSIYDGVTIEDDVFIGPHVVFTNDGYPRSISTKWSIIPTLLQTGCSVCANATIICGITIGKYAMVGAGAVVTKDILSFELVIGNPARHVGYVCKEGHKCILKLLPNKEIYCSICKLNIQQGIIT